MSSLNINPNPNRFDQKSNYTNLMVKIYVAMCLENMKVTTKNLISPT
ncbi:hypothetical protein MtrunA17_Chr6g0452981 [Medicago truncatula]|uniref:Uncharacterized protein n=1 Tax=Medicago truncatula TaxID=3880 RepID=A0A396HGJ8_MEDTR|nr:hypothetical protein MtrunA17_Chr6g0452981 [Medicago truncatula]